MKIQITCNLKRVYQEYEGLYNYDSDSDYGYILVFDFKKKIIDEKMLKKNNTWHTETRPFSKGRIKAIIYILKGFFKGMFSVKLVRKIPEIESNGEWEGDSIKIGFILEAIIKRLPE